MSRPFEYFLGSNYAPSDAEACQIRQIISDQDIDIALIDEEICRVQIMPEQLQHKRAGIKASQRAHQSLVSPVRRTPPEVWGEIFMQCLPADEFVEIQASAAPLLLGQVCSHWREIALSTQSL